MATQDKYDRQLRMWGSDGQSKLNKSKIICLGITPSGTECLKNLVLPGVGFIKIVSDRKIEQRDLGTNFFLSPEAVGKNMVENLLENLLELNSDVQGQGVVSSPQEYFKNHQDELKDFSLIICDGLSLVGLESKSQNLAIQINEFCEENQIKLVYIRSFGQIAYLRLYDKCFTSKKSLLIHQLSNQRKMEKSMT